MEYYIDGFSEHYKTLSDAKYKAKWFDTPNEHIRWYRAGDTNIIGVDKEGEVRSVTPIRVDDKGNVSFGRTRR